MVKFILIKIKFKKQKLNTLFFPLNISISVTIKYTTKLSYTKFNLKNITININFKSDILNNFHCN
jgi:hypothetical protein